MKLSAILDRPPHAFAELRGSSAHPGLRGTVRFYQTQWSLPPGAGNGRPGGTLPEPRQGVLIAAEFSGLPLEEGSCQSPIFAFHIHEGASCTGKEADPFAGAMAHYNPENCLHPYHAGDLPPVFGCHGYGLLIFMTDRFTVKEVLGKTVILHAHPDDFTTQPSGGAGEKLACGVIRPGRGEEPGTLWRA